MEVEVEVVEEAELRVLRRGHVSYRLLLLLPLRRQPEIARGRVCGGIRDREGEGRVALFRLGCRGPRYQAAVVVVAAHCRTNREDRVRRRSGDSRSWAGDGRDVSRLRDPIPAVFLAVGGDVGAHAGVGRGRR